MKAAYRFETDCVHCPTPELLQPMIEHGRRIKYRTVRRHLGALLDAWAEAKGYALDPRQGLHLKRDWAVRYYLSKYDGKRCLYIDWSAIEHVFVKEPDVKSNTDVAAAG